MPLIELVDVGKHYDDGDVNALRGVSLTIHAGEFVAIIGPSGCGKSTLLNLLGALDRPTSGVVSFGGQSLAEIINLDQFRAHQIGFIFQAYHLLPNLTAIENVQITMFDTHPHRRERQAEARRLLERVGLGDRLRHRPNQLSIGQRQRVAIARAIAGNPPLILADEPTGALDSVAGHETMDLLDELRTQVGSTLVVVTHDDRVAARADRIITMADGQIQSQDPQAIR